MHETLSLDYVRSTYTKKQSRGWKCVCPSCGGSDLWYTPENDSAFCFECGGSYKVESPDGKARAASGNVEVRPPTAEELIEIRRIYTGLQQHYVDSLGDSHLVYLRSRGIDDSTARSFGIGYCPTADQHVLYEDPNARMAGVVQRVADTNVPQLSDRIVFPYYVDGVATDMRGRAVQQEIEPRYKGLSRKSQERGAIYPFNYARALNAAREQKFVLLTEGEIKAIVADAHGFPCVALPGMLAWKHGFAVDPDVSIIVAFDSNSDEEDKHRVDLALHSLSRKLKPFFVVTMPLLGEPKMDIDLFLMHKRGGFQYFKSLVDNAVPYGTYVKLRRF